MSGEGKDESATGLAASSEKGGCVFLCWSKGDARAVPLPRTSGAADGGLPWCAQQRSYAGQGCPSSEAGSPHDSESGHRIMHERIDISHALPWVPSTQLASCAAGAAADGVEDRGYGRAGSKGGGTGRP
mmetsp:Transcript_5198/g.14010  ORF Transcript_5198/g.14010 Transcript_5198/m.14010 type:complete len:129 (+) Transcript_5198:146-532(+)